VKKKKYLDLTSYNCPMAFVKTKIFIENNPKNLEKKVLVKGNDNFLSIKESLIELNLKVKTKKLDNKIFEISIKN
tara:strand:- start:45 stop:269 length:225 start_codon:yes stop_codon:yes gene_type:complete